MKESNFQVISQRLKKIDYCINENFGGKNIELKVESKVEVKKDITQNIAFVSLQLFIFKDDDIKLVPFKIEIENVGLFKWDNTNDNDLIEKFLNYNAPALLLSNIRSLVSQITAFSSFPPLVLPLYNFTK